MIPVSRLTDQHACPIPLHGLTPLVSGSPAVFVNGLPVARVGDMSGCGAVIVSGFPHILVDGRPMAHVGSLTTHGGAVVTGSHDCVGGGVSLSTSKLVVDFAKLGAIGEDGVVDERLMAELLADPRLEQRAQAAGALVQSDEAPSLLTSFSRTFLITDSDTGKPLVNRAYTASVDGQRTVGLTDANGLAYVTAAKADAIIKLHVEFASPARALKELTEQPLGEDRFTTTAPAQYTRPGQPQTPVVVTINDRAATREAITRKIRELGHPFIERPEWRAKAPETTLERDWDYSMIALHHAGRSYSCGSGAQQMLEIQQMQQSKEDFTDIGYHFGIDCAGNIYEGRDIRFKGTHVLRFNTHVIGIVLLNNLTTPEEGGGLVAFGRKTLDSLGYGTTNRIPKQQWEATSSLITALSSVFLIRHLGGHKEFPHQKSNGKICPGNIAMEMIQALRGNTNLLPPPSE